MRAMLFVALFIVAVAGASQAADGPIERMYSPPMGLTFAGGGFVAPQDVYFQKRLPMNNFDRQIEAAPRMVRGHNGVVTWHYQNPPRRSKIR